MDECLCVAYADDERGGVAVQPVYATISTQMTDDDSRYQCRTGVVPRHLLTAFFHVFADLAALPTHDTDSCERACTQHCTHDAGSCERACTQHCTHDAGSCERACTQHCTDRVDRSLDAASSAESSPPPCLTDAAPPTLRQPVVGRVIEPASLHDDHRQVVTPPRRCYTYC